MGFNKEVHKNFYEKVVLKNFAILKHLNFRPATLLKETPTQVFSCEYCKIFKNSFFIEHLWWLLLKRSYSASPQEFCILRNVYQFFKFSYLASISQYGNTSWAMHLHEICHDSAAAGRERNNFQQLIQNLPLDLNSLLLKIRPPTSR